MKEEKQKLERFELANKPSLIITENLKKQIDFLHKRVGSFEWSGELITSEEGTIDDLDNWKIKAEDIFLVDVGTSGFTSYEVDKAAFKAGDIMEMYDRYPELLEGKKKIQHCHSHHKMGAFFSGTDWENLEDRSVISNYFLMLIVNFKGEYCAKVAFKAKVEGEKPVNIELVNNTDGYKPLTLKGSKDRDMLVVMDCKIEFEEAELGVSKEFQDRYDNVKKAIEEEKEKAEAKRKESFRDYKGQSTMFPEKANPWEDNYSRKNGRWMPKDKKVHEMTEKEFNRWEKKNQWKRANFHVLFNAIVDKSVKVLNVTGCQLRLEEISRKLKTTIDMENFLENFRLNLREYFDTLYLKKDSEDYADLLYLGMDILQPYEDNNKLTKEVFDLIWDEADKIDKASGKTNIFTDYPEIVQGWWGD